jgi:hypothetical protein
VYLERGRVTCGCSCAIGVYMDDLLTVRSQYTQIWIGMGCAISFWALQGGRSAARLH